MFLLLLLAAAFSVQAEDCSAWPPYAFQPSFSCEPGSFGVCRIGGPVTLTIIPFHPGAPVSCVSKVVWRLPDGAVTVDPYQPFSTSTLPVGAHSIPVDIYNTASSPNPVRLEIGTILVGVGFVNTSGGVRSVVEGESASFYIVRNAAIGPTTVKWIVTDSINGTTPSPEFPTSSGTSTLADGQSEQLVTVPTSDDAIYRGNKEYYIKLLSATNDYVLPPGYGYLTVFENEPRPKLSVQDVALPELDSGRRAGSFTVKLSVAVPSLAVSYSIADGSARAGNDYVALPGGSIHFDPAHTEISIPFEIIGDRIREPHETFRLHLYTLTPGLIAMPPDATCTILNDDSELLPSLAQLGKGQSLRYTLHIGLPAASTLSIPLEASDPSVVSLPASIRFDRGQSTATFTVTAIAAGQTRIRAQLPPENGGGAPSATLIVHESGKVVFSPRALEVFRGEEAELRVSLDPPSTQNERLLLTTGNPDIAGIANEVVIPAGGSGTITVKGLSPGPTFVNATLPPAFGDGYATAAIDVIERPAAPVITSVEPQSGTSAGGTPVVVRGALLTADCTLLFGNVPAKNVVLDEEGSLNGVTPPHKSGAVDVMLQCGSDMFVLTNAFTYTDSRQRSARH